MANPFDQFDAPRANPFDQFDPGYKPPSRSLGAVLNDTVIEAGNAIAGAVGSIGNFVAPGNRVSQFIDEKIVKPGQEAQSDVVKASNRQYEQEIAQADGVMGELGAVARKIARDPLLTAAQAAGSFAVPGAAIKGAGAIARGLGAGAAGVANAGLAGGAASGAALSGGDAAGTAYELATKAGASEEDAVKAARQASVLPAAVGALGGVSGAEKLFAGAGGLKGSAISRALKTAGIEGLQEGFEEGITKYEGQRAAQPFDPSIDPMKGVAAAAGMGAAMGGVTGAAVSAFHGEPAVNVQARIEEQRADQALAAIGGATTADEAINAAMKAVPPVSPLVPSLDENAAMGRMEAQAADDQKQLKQYGAAPGFTEPPAAGTQAAAAPPVAGGPAAQAQASIADLPFADRVMTLREQLQDDAVREQVRARFGDEAMREATYYAAIADNPNIDLPEKTRERMLSLAETLVSQSIAQPVASQPQMAGQPAAPRLNAPAAVPEVPRIGLNTEPTGVMRVNAAGQAAPETRADVISAADRERAAAVRPDGMTGSFPQGFPDRPGVMVGEGQLQTATFPERQPAPEPAAEAPRALPAPQSQPAGELNGPGPAPTGRPDEGSAGRGDQLGGSMEPARLLADEPGRGTGSGGAGEAVPGAGPDLAAGSGRADDAVAPAPKTLRERAQAMRERTKAKKADAPAPQPTATTKAREAAAPVAAPARAAKADVPGAGSAGVEADGLKPPVEIREEDIPYQVAYEAHRNTSFVPDERARQRQKDYANSLRDAWKQGVAAAGNDPDALARVSAEFEKLAGAYRSAVVAYLNASSRTASSMITGPAKFPTERNRKRMEAADNKAAEASEILRKGIERMKKAAKAPIDNSPAGEVARIRENLAQREREQELMKATNAALRKKDDAALRALGLSDQRIAELKKPDFAGRTGIPGYALTNNNAEIRRLRDRLAQAEQRAQAAEAAPVEREVSGVRVEEDAEADSLKLFFPDKPSFSVRAELKRNAFKWAPSTGAWQRQLTDNARRAADSVLAKYAAETGSETAAAPVQADPGEDASTLQDIAGALQTETAAFKRWFGDSKVVDADGKPLVVYHGTTADFDTFKRSSDGKAGAGIYMTGDASYTSVWGRGDGANVMPVYVSIENPIVLQQSDGLPLEAISAKYPKVFKGRDPFDLSGQEIAAAIRSAGFDGVIQQTQASPFLEVMALDPQQIKSAIGNSGAFDAGNPSILADLNRIGTTIAAQGYEKSEVPRVQAARKLQGLLAKRDAGEISDGMFETSLRLLAQRLTEASDAKQANRLMSERERGADIVREKLIRARRQGDMDPEAVEFALWAIDQNPSIAERLGISVRSPKDGTASGDYNPAVEIMRLFKGSSATGTAVHEILHHTERMMPADMQEAIRREWAATLAKAMRKATPEQAAALENVIPAMAGDKAAYKALVKAIQEGPLNYDEHYQLTNPSEFWAVNATKLMAERFAARDSVWKRIATWMRETVQKARALVGLRSTAPLIRALDAVLEGDGSRQSKEMLSARGPAGGNFQDIAATAPSSYLGELTPEQEAALKKVGAMGKAPPTYKERFAGLRQNLGLRITQAVADQFAPLKELDAKAYLLARMSKGADGTLEAAMLYGKPYLRDGVPDVKVDEGGFAKTLAMLQGEHQRFLWWVSAQRAERLKAAGLENLFGDQDIKTLKTLNEGKMKDGADREAVYRTALKQMNEFNDSVLQMAQESGLIDQETVDLYRGLPYVPFFRVTDDGEFKGPRSSSSLTNQKAWKKLKGGTQQLNDDLLANVLQNWSHLYTAAAKNRAALASIEAAMRMDIAYPINPNKDSTKGTVKVMRNGVAEHYAIEDPYIMSAVAAVSYMSPEWLKPFSTFKRWLTIGVTASPVFKVKNLLRDSIAALAVSDLGPNVFENVAKGFKATGRESQTYASMLAAGGVLRFGTSLEGQRSSHAQAMIDKFGGTVLDEKAGEKLLRQIKDLWEGYQLVGDRMESVNRAALYDQLIAKGKSHAEASFMARDLMDFSMSGQAELVRWLVQMVPFLNARVQGLYKLGRGAAENPRKFGAVAAAVSLASLALLLAYQDDDDFKKREDWDRDTYWWFKVGDTAYRIPKPFEVGAIGTMAERSWELMFSEDMDAKRFGNRLSDMIFKTFAFNPMPQIIRPIMDVYANRDALTGKPIEPIAMERLRPEDRQTEQTTSLARMLGSLGLPDPGALMNARYEALSPVQVDYLIRGYFGWVGAQAAGAIDVGTRQIEDRGAMPKMTLKSLTGGFVADVDEEAGSRYVAKFYADLSAIEQAYASYRDALKRGDVQAASEIKEEEASNIAKYKRAQAVKRRLAELNREARSVERDRAVDGATKREQLSAINRRRSDVAERF